MGRINSRTGIFPTTHTWELDTTLIKVKLSVPYLYLIRRKCAHLIEVIK